MRQNSNGNAITIDVASESFNRAEKLLAGIKGGARVAVSNALERAGTSGRAYAAKAISEEYTLSQSDVRSNTKNFDRIKRNADGQIEITFGYSGNVIPLIKFDTSIGKDGRITTRVKRSSAKGALDHAFTASVHTHTGIFEREYDELRLPIEELYGPSVPQMMYSNEAVRTKIESRALETYEKRIEHEITRLLNGWGG
jgi:hypothetical protein